MAGRAPLLPDVSGMRMDAVPLGTHACHWVVGVSVNAADHWSLERMLS
jgi:hypothetical protein